MTRSFVCEVTVQTHLKLDVFLYAEAYKNRSFTAFDARRSVLESSNATLHVHALDRACTL